MSGAAAKTAVIAHLNDLARRAMGVGCKLVVTPGIRALPDAVQSRIRERVELFDDFKESNDPYGEHDFGAFDQAGAGKVFWKIDYYGPDFMYLSENPASTAATRRVLTIMLAEEY
jgi:hypothetical protein